MPEWQHPAEWVIERLRSEHDRADFSCGNASLDRYLKEQAGQDLRRACATAFVLVPKRGDSSILGYYTLSSYGIDVGDLPADVAKKLPRYPLIPATLLGRLAVDRRYQGQGIGEFFSWMPSTAPWCNQPRSPLRRLLWTQLMPAP